MLRDEAPTLRVLMSRHRTSLFVSLIATAAILFLLFSSSRAGEVLKLVYAAGLPVQDVETRKSRLEDVLIQVLHSQKASA